VYQEEITNLRGTRDELEEMCISLRDKATDSLNAKNEAERDLTALRNEIVVESDNLQMLIAEQDKQLREIDRVAQSLQAQRDQQSDIELDLDILYQREKDLQRLEREIENAQYQLDLLVERAVTAETDVRTRQEELLESETRWNQMQLDVQQFEARIADLERGEEAANQNLSSLKMKEEEAIAYHEGIRNDAESGRRELEELHQEIKANEARNVEVSSRLQSLADEVKEAQSIAEQWQAYIVSLQREIQDSTTRKASLEKEIESLQSKTASLQSETRSARDLLDSMNAEHHAIVDQRTAAEQVLSQINSDVKSAESQLSIYFTQQRDAEDALRKLESERTELENDIALAVDQWELEQSKVSDLQSQFHPLKNLIVELQKEKEQHLLQIESLKEESESLGESNQESRARLSQLKVEILSLELTANELEKLQGDCVDRNTELRRLAMELDELNNRKQVAEQEVLELEQKQQGLYQVEQEFEDKSIAMANLKIEYQQRNDQLRLLENEISAKNGVKASLAELENRLQETDLTLKALNEERLLRESNLKEIDKLIVTRDEELHRVTLLVQSKDVQIQELAEAIATRQEEAEGLTNRIEQSHKEIRKLATLRSSTEETIAELMQDVDRRREEILLCRQELKTAEQSEEAMKMQIASVESQMERLRKEKHELENQSAATKAQLEAGEAELLAIRSQSMFSAAEANALEKTIRSLQDEIVRVSDELQTMKLERESIPLLVETDNSTIQSEDLRQNDETSAVEPTTQETVREQDAQEMKTEEDVWTALNALRQLEETVRVDSRGFDSNRSEDRRATDLKTAARVPKQIIPRNDAWAEIFAKNG
jgi:chromosome segregation ATPase